jgi:hypothetical protein
MNDRSADNPAEWARKAVAAWLASPAGDRTEKLVRWFQGYDEAAGWGEEPYRWILNSLPKHGAARKDAEDEVAATLAEILKGRPDIEVVVRRPQQLLYNALSLAAGLRYKPAWLWRPLREIWERQKLAGQYYGTDLRAVLRAALIANQADGSLGDVWIRMGEGTEEFLPGSPIDASYGAIMLPLQGGQPSSHLPGALKNAARYLDGDFDLRRPRFRRLVEAVKTAHPLAGPGWDPQLLRFADNTGWPTWTASCLELFTDFEPPRLSALPGAVGLGLADKFGIEPRERLWDDRIWVVHLAGDPYQLFRQCRRIVQNFIGSMPGYQSDGAWNGTFFSALREFAYENFTGATVKTMLEAFGDQFPILGPSWG